MALEPSESRSKALMDSDGVAEEVDADRQADLVAAVFAGEVDVDDPAAHGEVAGHLHLLQPVVAVIAEPDDQLLRLQVLPGLDGADDVLERVRATAPIASARGPVPRAGRPARRAAKREPPAGDRFDTCSSLIRPRLPASSSAGSTSGRPSSPPLPPPWNSCRSSARSSASSRWPQISRSGRFSSPLNRRQDGRDAGPPQPQTRPPPARRTTGAQGRAAAAQPAAARPPFRWLVSSPCCRDRRSPPGVG